MCSFQYLNEFPVDYLKIDGNFVKNIDQSAFNKSVIESISQIGHSLGLKIVAEFVENQSIMDCLDTSLIDYVQGYAIEYPRPVDDLFDLCRLEPA
jgi:EAL domain-containing protein (putative c-di-GMP-specific phosphodiesterase class I)